MREPLYIVVNPDAEQMTVNEYGETIFMPGVAYNGDGYSTEESLAAAIRLKLEAEHEYGQDQDYLQIYRLVAVPLDRRYEEVLARVKMLLAQERKEWDLE